MNRRIFVKSSLAASALAAAMPGKALEAAQKGSDGRQFYQLRRYHFNNGPQRQLCDNFFRDALLPALNRLSIAPVGVFNISVGPESPSMYVLMPSVSAEILATVEARLAQDATYMMAGAPFLNAPEKDPAFDRMESTLLQAFEKWPKIVLPTATASRGPRVFELRVYESATDQDHKRKVEMMQSGESEIFTKAGIEQVLYSDTLIGSRLPSLTYMLAFDNMVDRDKKWSVFQNSEDWKTFSALPKYSFEPIVSNINNFILTPTAYSQI